MNKFIILLLFIIFFNHSNSQEISDEKLDQIYDKVIFVLKGMSQNEKNQCFQVFMNNKQKLINLIKSIINEYEKGDKDFISKILLNYGVPFFLIDNVGSKCNLINIQKAWDRLTTEYGIKEIGKAISNNSEVISNNTQIVKNDEKSENKFIALGKIISIILDFYVN